MDPGERTEKKPQKRDLTMRDIIFRGLAIYLICMLVAYYPDVKN